MKRLGAHVIPRDDRLHLAWRYFAYTKTRLEPKYQPVFKDACKRSCIFYQNTFVWLKEPRRVESTIPMNTFDFQDELTTTTIGNLRKSATDPEPGAVYDVLVEKSRGMGVTWDALSVLDWFWRFVPGSQFLAISEKEDKVDRIGDVSALLPKLDFVEERMPAFLQVRGSHHDQYHGRRHLVVFNPLNGSSITGESANADAGRSGRYLGVLRDEEAAAPFGTEITNALNATTRCQIRVSTPRGTANSFYEARKKADTERGKGIKVVTLHWSQHPYFARGLYEWNGQEVRVKDGAWHAAYKRDKGRPYPYRQEATYADPGAPWERFRSPWFDAECQRSETIKGIAQELQISYLGSGSPFFSPQRMADIRRSQCRSTQWSGDLQELLGKDFVDSDVRPNRARCWFQVLGNKPPQKTTYTVAADIGTGTGVSDSTISVGDDRLKIKVFEFETNGILPEQFAVVVRHVCEWFTTAEGQPFLAWDAGGPGQSFGVQFMQLGTTVPVYWHKMAGTGKRARLPGVHFSGMLGRPKLDLFTNYRQALFGGWYATPSAVCYDQCSEYIFDQRGLPTHTAAEKSETPEGQGDQHGDVVCSEVILHEAMQNRPLPRPVKAETPVGSFKWRGEQAAAAAKATAAWGAWG